MLLLIILLIYVQKNKEMMKYFEILVLFAVNLATIRLYFVYRDVFFSTCSGLDRKSFDNKHVTFEDHIRKVHNMWNYVYFMVLIHVKDPTEYTGPESYVHEMIEVCVHLKINSHLFIYLCLVKTFGLVSENANE